MLCRPGAAVVNDLKPGAWKNRHAPPQAPGAETKLSAGLRAHCGLRRKPSCLFCGPLAFLGSGGPPPTPPASSVCVSLLYVPSTHPFNLRSLIYDHLTLRLLTQSHCKYPFSKPGHVHSFQRLVVHDIPPAGSLSNLRQRLNVMKCAPLTPCVEIPSLCTSEYNYIWR